MHGGCFPEAMGTVATTVPLIRDHMLTTSERVDLARLLISMETMKAARRRVKVLKAPPYWELMQELDKVAVHRLRDELTL